MLFTLGTDKFQPTKPLGVTNLAKTRPQSTSFRYKPASSYIIAVQTPTTAENLSFFTIPGLALFAFGITRSGFKRLFRRGRRNKKSVTKMVDGNVAEFSIATFNLRGISDRWTERWPVLKSCLKDINADILCFQECLTGEYAQDRVLLGSSYHVFPCKTALYNLLSSGNSILRWYAQSVSKLLSFGPILRLMVGLPAPVEAIRERFRLTNTLFTTLRDMTIAPFFGNSIGCRLVDAHEIKHSTLVLGDWRAAQRIEFELKEDESEDGQGPHAVHSHSSSSTTAGAKFKIWIVNTHLDHEHADNRQRQALEVINWMEQVRSECAAVILAGDFNGSPDEPFHRLLRAHGYKSGYSMRHGKDPQGTWPTGIEAPCKDEGPFECLDYIYVWANDGYQLEITDAAVYGDSPDPKDPTIFPSDHAAIKVCVKLEKIVEKAVLADGGDGEMNE